ncbi:MAG TPA: CDP-glucose 4,6-dehydratase [Opitutaceae bacterium]|nr:CDP-glucose 4,6-dehydratase [Opitutaceae bacterium]
MLFDLFRGKRVFLTGHTGFKGAWMAEWLLELGADVTGFSLAPPTKPALFEQLQLQKRLDHLVGDIRDLSALKAALRAAAPEFIFHLAAQSLVRRSYDAPVETFGTNVLGTVNVLEAVRSLETRCAVVVATTDKCYLNTEHKQAFGENDPLGGRDPYSASKAGAELAANAYRSSFFQNGTVAMATARAGNVLGGGDWAADRILPDCIRALSQRQPICIRNPDAVRPWQHVLESVSGYLTLGARLFEAQGKSSAEALRENCDAFNFGPSSNAERTVRELVNEVLKTWPGTSSAAPSREGPHEAHCLRLSIEKARRILGWTPVWDFEKTVARTVEWYRKSAENGDSIQALTHAQIDEYLADARATNAGWTT